ncbi:MAG TPA: VWA domain-containing protein [Candidatus Limnocylindria bacterium]|nr:VWA domain-containing protein [Candidatus Limnocylindria bacterium]
MELSWPGALVTLLLVPALAALYVVAQRRRRRYALRYASVALVREAVGPGPGVRRHIPAAIFLVALASMLFALSRPQAVTILPSEEGTVILALDTSGSMQAEDLRPSRMEAAKSAAMGFVDKQSKAVRIGVVSFSDNAFLVQAPTDDKEAVKAAIARLRPQRGTAIGRGILASLDAIFESSEGDAGAPAGAQPTPTPRPLAPGQFAPASIVLLTDGENNVFPPPLSIVNEAVDRGIRVYTIGVGSPEGTILRIQGRQIRTRLDEATLKRVAEVTKADYYLASDEAQLKRVYEQLTTTVVLRPEKTELTFAFTGLAAVLATIAGMLSLAWSSKLP